MGLPEQSGSPVKFADFYVQPKDSIAEYVRADEDGKAVVDVVWGDITIEANEDDHKPALADITIPEGQEVYELTLTLNYYPGFRALLDEKVFTLSSS